jgi:hypothetical protein
MGSRSGFCRTALVVICLLSCELGAQTPQPDLSGLVSEDRTSIEAACSTAKYLSGPAAYHACLQTQLDALSGSRFPDLSGLSSEDRTSIEAACSTAKYLNGPASYHKCLQKQLNAMSGSRFPDLSELSSEDRTSIEATCSTAKYLGGPASYHACLQKQLNALSGSGFPDLSGLSSEDRSSIEAACSTAKYLGGPASYHDCLGRQLRQIGDNVSIRGNQTPTYLLAQAKPIAPPQMSPSPELKRLRYFIGTWTIAGEMKATSFSPPGKFTGTHRNEWSSDGLSLISNWDEQRTGSSDSGQATYGYDSSGKNYTYHSVDTSGEKEDSLGSVDGQTWTWLSSPTLADGSAVKGRFIVKEESATAYSFKFETAAADDWTVVMEGKASKKP